MLFRSADGTYGYLHFGWVSDPAGNYWFFDLNTAAMAKGWLLDGSGNAYYFFEGDGVLALGGFQASNGNWYYSDPQTGVLRYGWQDTFGNGVEYYYHETEGYLMWDMGTRVRP